MLESERSELLRQGVLDDTLFSGGPKPIASIALTAPPMAAELVPEAFRPWVQDVAARMNVSLEMIAMPMLVAAASLISRSIAIRPKRYDDWTVVPNVWGCIIGRSAMLKSPAMNQALAPFRSVEEQLRVEFEAAQPDRQLDKRMVELAINRLEALLRKQKHDDDTRAELKDKHTSLAALSKSEPRRSTNDPTVEKLGELLRDHGGLLLVRDELTGWLKSLDKPGREGDREFYLEAWNGDGAFTVDRIGRGSIHIRSHRISIIGTATPGAIRAYVSAALADGSGADGLMQRFQLVIWPDELPAFVNVDREPNEQARRQARAVFQALGELERIGAARDCAEGLRYFRFDHAGQVVFDNWRSRLEKRLRSEFVDEPALESHIAKFRSLMPSLALLFRLVGGNADVALNPRVGEREACLALDWCDFLEQHARKLYAEGGVLVAARRLAERIEEGEVRSGDTVRDIYRRGWRGLPSPEHVMAALRVLEGAHWVIVEDPTDHGPGRPASPRVIVHPSVGPCEAGPPS